MLDPDKQKLYRAVQRTHLHASPDGPWFFIVARSQPDEDRYDLLGITDTSMLRPQVFALYENSPPDSPPHRGGRGAGVQIGLIASERQAINACLRSLAAEDARYKPQADRYWVARGGSHTDGGAFRFSVSRSDGLTCADKFGRPVSVTEGGHHLSLADLDAEPAPKAFRERWKLHALHAHDDGGPATFWRWLSPHLSTFSWGEADWGLDWLERFGRHGDAEWRFALETLSRLRDRVYDPGEKRRASLLSMVDERLAALLAAVPSLDKEEENTLVTIVRLTWDDRACLRPPVREDRGPRAALPPLLPRGRGLAEGAEQARENTCAECYWGRSGTCQVNNGPQRGKPVEDCHPCFVWRPR